MELRVTDNDKGEITVTGDGCELRGWSYESEDERRQKMMMAREYVEGWSDCEAAGDEDETSECPLCGRTDPHDHIIP